MNSHSLDKLTALFTLNEVPDCAERVNNIDGVVIILVAPMGTILLLSAIFIVLLACYGRVVIITRLYSHSNFQTKFQVNMTRCFKRHNKVDLMMYTTHW